jgi:transcriptional regulator with XRE-family HTH domain
MKRDETFGIRLRYYRSLSAWSQEELAEAAAYTHHNAPSQRDISLYESDRSLPRLDKFAALVDALALTKEEVMSLVRLAERLKIPAQTVSEPGTSQPPAAVPGTS